ncbi:tyrosine-type recombinase/integrase [Staphylococcus coagulans]|uniref:tyrosine-type recombinase/integrase n=1 Tax=Staphylococcus coagulans TaxID=74706 RepID=UPI0015F800CA|nr:site-specific integrase [Staphylococcus coagulans]MBA8761762.1 tyrosine-type recombinase/integrase [Staphylococcus coagulans]
MWVEQYKDKNNKTKYRYYEKYKDPYTNKWRRVSVVMNKNTRQAQKEALLQLSDKIKIKQNEKSSNYKDITLSNLIYAWFKFYKHTSGTKESWHNKINHFINKIFKEIDGDTLVKNIDRKMIQDLMIKIVVEEDFTESYARKIRFVIKSSLEFARKEYGLDNTKFLKDVIIPKKEFNKEKLERQRNNYLEKEEMAQVLNVFNELISKEKRDKVRINLSIIKNICEIQALTGMRIGEVLALQNEDIDIKNKTIDINGAIFFKNTGEGYGIKTTTKTEGSNRKITINDRALTIIRRLQLRNKQFERWEKGYNNRGFVFTNRRGNPIHLNSVLNHLKTVELILFKNQKRKLTTHTFRHTHISTLTEMDVPLKAIMERVGHVDERTTLRIYTHVTKNMRDRITNELKNFSF